ncbi:MAG: hypothetical protein KKG76_06360 [Euryarchaeota archaeon]|nr:hypothetical protein [Euryarchaeota archaeon]
MNEIPKCSEKLPDDISEMIRELGKQWKQSEINHIIKQEIINKWDNLIDEWFNTSDIPIIVRKSRGIRGSEKTHKTGRKIIISDNSTAQWVCYKAMQGIVPTLEDIQEYLEKDEIPISFAIKKAEKEAIKYKCTLKNYSINKHGWKLCHKKGVGLNTKNDISDIDMDKLKESFSNLMKPSNFFLLPIQWGGLGEIQEFIDEMK